VGHTSIVSCCCFLPVGTGGFSFVAKDTTGRKPPFRLWVG
jgi:hypothetical protein